MGNIMGNRGQVKIEPSNVYLYTHWYADTLPSLVKAALLKRCRWDDEEYLARIVFDVMTECGRDSEKGFGIGTSEYGDIEVLVTINCDSKSIIVDKSMCGGTKQEPMTFESFVSTPNA